MTSAKGVGIPIKLLHEAEGHHITVNLFSASRYARTVIQVAFPGFLAELSCHLCARGAADTQLLPLNVLAFFLSEHPPELYALVSDVRSINYLVLFPGDTPNLRSGG